MRWKRTREKKSPRGFSTTILAVMNTIISLVCDILEDLCGGCSDTGGKHHDTFPVNPFGNDVSSLSNSSFVDEIANVCVYACVCVCVCARARIMSALDWAVPFSFPKILSPII